MCFDIQSSLLAWSLTYSISIYLYFRNQNFDRWNAVFIMTFSTIQLLEAGIWYSIGENKKTINETLTKLILITLMLQPLAQSYMGYLYAQKFILAVLSSIIAGVLIWSIIRIVRATPGQFITNTGPRGHLIWSDSKSPNFLGGWWIALLYLIGLFVPLFFMSGGKGVALLMIGVVTAIFSLMVASKEEFSSYWCYTTVIYAMVALFI